MISTYCICSLYSREESGSELQMDFRHTGFQKEKKTKPKPTKQKNNKKT